MWFSAIRASGSWMSIVDLINLGCAQWFVRLRRVSEAERDRFSEFLAEPAESDFASKAMTRFHADEKRLLIAVFERIGPIVQACRRPSNIRTSSERAKS